MAEDDVVSRVDALRELTAPGQPYELETVELYGQNCRAFLNAPPTLRDLFADNRSDLPFIVFEDERYSYEEVWQLACRYAAILVDDFGVRKGDCVAISMRNYPEWIIAFTAVTSIGGIAVAMNALWQPREMEYGLHDSGAKVLFADQERLDHLLHFAQPLQDLIVLGVRPNKPLAPGVYDLARLLTRSQATTMPHVDIHPVDDATIFYTSGSTGHPKGAVSCHLNIITALFSWELDARAGALMKGMEFPTLQSQPVVLLAVPLFHATGSHAVYLASYRAQRRIVCMYKWEVARAAEIIERERVSAFIAPAAMTGDLVEFARKETCDLSSLATVGGGGAPRAPEQVRNIERIFTHAMPGTGWGMTETNAIGTGINGAEYLQRPESSGRCSAVLELRIIDEQGDELPTGTRGELLIRGTSVIRGYWNRPDANAETFVDGWLRTGDVAYLDDDGFLFIVDRIKDLVIRGGENIGCGAIESVLLEHPGIVEASVYAVPDERLGEEVGTTVYTREPMEEAALRSFLQPRLTRFEVPRFIHFSDEPLPRTASGKILKRQLREEACVRWLNRAVTT